MNNALHTRPHWFVPMATLTEPGAILSSARGCLPGSATIHGVSLVLVFEDHDDATKYFSAYQEAAARSGTLIENHQVHKLTPGQVHDVFMTSRRVAVDVVFLPVAVFHEDAEEVIDKTRDSGPSAASEIATVMAALRAKKL